MTPALTCPICNQVLWVSALTQVFSCKTCPLEIDAVRLQSVPPKLRQKALNLEVARLIKEVKKELANAHG